MATEGTQGTTEDITSGGDLAPSYTLMRGPPRKDREKDVSRSLRTGLERPPARTSPDRSRHGLYLPGRAMDHMPAADRNGYDDDDRAGDRDAGIDYDNDGEDGEDG